MRAPTSRSTEQGLGLPQMYFIMGLWGKGKPGPESGNESKEGVQGRNGGGRIQRLGGQQRRQQGRGGELGCRARAGVGPGLRTRGGLARQRGLLNWAGGKRPLGHSFHQETRSQRWGWRASWLQCSTRHSLPKPTARPRAPWGCCGCPWR